MARAFSTRYLVAIAAGGFTITSALCALAIYGACCWLNGYMDADWGYAEMFLPQALRGISMMFIFLPINALALGTLPAHEVQNASGLFNLMRNLGGAIGLAVANTLLVQWRKEHHAHLRTYVTPSDSQAQVLSQQLHAAAARNSSPDANRAALDMSTNMVWREADVITVNQMFLLLGGIFFAALLLIPLVRKVDMAKSGAGH